MSQSRKALLYGFDSYIFYEALREEKNFATLLDMIDASEAREDDETYMNPIDILFEALEKKKTTHFQSRNIKSTNLLREKQQSLFLYHVVQGLLHLIFRSLGI
ncbi:hypothetical protein HMPREF2957_08185 [Streptococcus sp. HMSC062D07]|nr:hypothetical protein [Streptococcus sp. HMSC062D07]OFQ06438.1 hypothetical protein HMPREF2957_08185 [Streptococcus sp. HMSC062D07]